MGQNGEEWALKLLREILNNFGGSVLFMDYFKDEGKQLGEGRTKGLGKFVF